MNPLSDHELREYCIRINEPYYHSVRTALSRISCLCTHRIPNFYIFDTIRTVTYRPSHDNYMLFDPVHYFPESYVRTLPTRFKQQYVRSYNRFPETVCINDNTLNVTLTSKGIIHIRVTNASQTHNQSMTVNLEFLQITLLASSTLRRSRLSQSRLYPQTLSDIHNLTNDISNLLFLDLPPQLFYKTSVISIIDHKFTREYEVSPFNYSYPFSISLTDLGTIHTLALGLFTPSLRCLLIYSTPPTPSCTLTCSHLGIRSRDNDSYSVFIYGSVFLALQQPALHPTPPSDQESPPPFESAHLAQHTPNLEHAPASSSNFTSRFQSLPQEIQDIVLEYFIGDDPFIQASHRPAGSLQPSGPYRYHPHIYFEPTSSDPALVLSKYKILEFKYYYEIPYRQVPSLSQNEFSFCNYRPITLNTKVIYLPHTPSDIKDAALFRFPESMESHSIWPENFSCHTSEPVETIPY